MRTAFLHEEEHEQCLSAQHELVTRFRESESGTDPGVDGVEFALREKSYRDGLLARWTSDDLRWLLLDAAPAGFVPSGRLSDVPDALHRWIDFLHRSELLMASETPDDLAATIASVTPEYLRAMADPQQWAYPKLVAMAGGEHSEDRARQEWGDALVDRAIDRADTERSPGVAEWLPPMRVRDASASLAEGSGTDAVDRARKLIRWIDAGGVLDPGGIDDAGTVVGVHGRELELTVAWAVRAHLVRVADDRIRTTALGTSLGEEPRALWARLWDTLPGTLREATPPNELPRPGFADAPLTDDEIVDTVLTEILRRTYSTPDPIPFELLVDVVSARLHAVAGLDPEPGPSPLRARVHAFVELFQQGLVASGVLRSYRTTDPQQVERLRRAFPAGHEPELTMLELLPLGVWAARESLRAAGFVAPTVEEIAELPAEAMVLTVPHSPDDTVEDVIEAWIERRDRESACRELTSLLTRVDDPLVRMVTLHVLDRTGRAGVDAALALREDPLAGAAVRLWLQGRPGAGKVALHPTDEVQMSLDGMALSAFADVPGLIALFSQWSPQERGQVIEQVRDSGHSGAATILEALATNHTDTATSQAAARALSSVR